MNVPADQLARRSPEQRRVSPRDSQGLDSAAHDSTRPGSQGLVSAGQRALWFLHQSSSGGSSYNLICSLKLTGDVDVAALGRAVRLVWNRNPSLRTTFSFNNGEISQTPGACVEPHVRLEDQSGWSEARRNQRWTELSDAPFDLQSGPLMRAVVITRGPDEVVLHVALHHIIADFWTMSVFIAEIGAAYVAECGGEPPTLPTAEATYAQFVDWQRRMLAGPEGAQHREYWRRRLEGAPSLLPLPTDRPQAGTAAAHGAAFSLVIDDATLAPLRALAQSEGTTPYVVCLSAFYALLHRYCGQQDLVVASPTLGRNDARWAGVLGYFTNPVALRAVIEEGQSFRSLIRQVRDTVRDGMIHGDFPFSEVVDLLEPERAAGRPPLAQVMFAWERTQRFDGARVFHLQGDTGAVSVEYFGVQWDVDFEQRGAPFELTVQIYEDVNSLRTRWQYAKALFDESTIARMAEHYRTLLRSAVEDADRSTADLPLLTAEERRQLTALGTGPRREYQTDVCLDEWLDRQAAATPDAPAVRFREESLTYRELSLRTDRLAVWLQSIGVGANSVVGVYMNRSTEMVVALLGIVKAGGAYMPLNPEDPIGRIAFQLDDAGVSVVLTQQALHAALVADAGVPNRRIVALDDVETYESLLVGSVAAAAARRKLSRPESLAYVIYTSGSTGRPKGVMTEHRAIVNRLQWMQEEYGLAADDRVLQKTPATFDVSVWEFFWPLISGAELIVAEPGGHRDAAYLARLIVERRITTLHFVPTMLRAFLDQADLPQFESLRRVFASGEALTTDLVEKFRGRCRAQLHNLYGPTEAAVDVTYWSCNDAVVRDPVPIGRPIANMETLVLDPHGGLQPVGVPGELCLAGIGLARGYLNRPDLTAERFAPHPFRSGERIYRTGDLARWTADGVIEYLGRMDGQIKLGGNRIELGEIEVALSSCVGVSQAVVDVREEAGELKRIVGYLVPAPGSVIELDAVRRTLSERLPPYMIPAAFVTLESLPTTASGKVDRKALPAPARARAESATPYLAPRTTAERELSEIFADVLQIDRIGVHDNFFDLGGASNQAVEIIRRANLRGYAVTPELVFKHPTIAGVAEACVLPQPPTGNSVVESLGVYLPPRAVSSDEIMAGCRKKLSFPLRRLTGIQNRRVAGETEFSYDLAERAVEECLRRAKGSPLDVDAVICCNISRFDGPNFNFTHEPSTAIRLCRKFGMSEAFAFDISNACAGMFTGMSLADGLLKSGLIGKALVVSGEYISYLANSAQKSIETDFDSRLPCLTVGDAGAALLMTASNDRRVGLHDIDLCTLSEHSELCIAKLGDEGPIMYTDMLGVSSVITQQGLEHWIRTVRRKGWALPDVQHVIPHQVSQTTIVNGFSEMRKRSGTDVPEDRVISNVAERGNTATTSHWVAVWDHIRSGRIKSGDNVVFGVSGSGITVGTALYKFDDLPDRVRAEPAASAGTPSTNGHAANGHASNGHSSNGHSSNGHATNGALGNGSLSNGHASNGHVSTQAQAADATAYADTNVPITAAARRRRRRLDPRLRSVVVSGCGTYLPHSPTMTALDLAQRAAEAAVREAAVPSTDVQLMIYSGIYRDEYLCEPAVATMLADRMRLHPKAALGEHPKFFAFDVLNGSVGFLQSCYLATQRIQAGLADTAVVATAEVEIQPSSPVGLQPSGGAFVLSVGRPAGEETAKVGFGEFLFTNDLNGFDRREVMTNRVSDDGKFQMEMLTRSAADLPQFYADAVALALPELLERDGLTWNDVAWVLPPHVGPTFAELLTERVPQLRDKLIPLEGYAGDLFTAAAPFAWQELQRRGGLQPGRVGIFIGVGAGVQVALATYRS